MSIIALVKSTNVHMISLNLDLGFERGVHLCPACVIVCHVWRPSLRAFKPSLALATCNAKASKPAEMNRRTTWFREKVKFHLQATRGREQPDLAALQNNGFRAVPVP